MKWIIGGFSHETNTFSSEATGLEQFRERHYAEGDEVAAELEGTRTNIGGFLDVIRERGDEAVLTVSAFATPSGLVTREAFDTISGVILDGVRKHTDADGILLDLHGAMVPEGSDDGEGCVLEMVREVVGPEMPIVVALDLHSHITELMVEKADVLIGYQKYPHTDMYERGVEAANLIVRIASGEVHPVCAMRKPGMIPVPPTCNTEWGLYKSLWEDALRADRPGGIISTSLFAGFPWADVAPIGFAILVYTDGDENLAREEAERLSEKAWNQRQEFLYTPTSIPEAVSRALKVEGRPVVIPDVADNPGGGGSNDSVEVVRELLAQKAPSAAISTIYDPIVVQEAIKAGVGSKVSAELGAKTDDLHGQPLEIDARVRMISDGRYRVRGRMSQGAWMHMGPTAVLEVEGVRILVASYRQQTYDTEAFRYVGIDPMDTDVLVVKSAMHFNAAFRPIASEVIVADGPGLSSNDMSRFAFERIPRPIFPLDDT